MDFPKTIKGYMARIKDLDDSVIVLKNYDMLSEDFKDVRAYIAEAVDTYKIENNNNIDITKKVLNK